MKSLRLDKKARLAIDKILTIILIVLVVAIVFMLISEANILRYLRNLPEYGVSEEDEEIDIGEEPYKISDASLSIQGDKLILKVIHSCDEIKFKVNSKPGNWFTEMWGMERMWREGIFSGRTQKLSLIDLNEEGITYHADEFKEGVYYAKTSCMKEGKGTREEEESNIVVITQKVLEDAENYEPPKLLELMESSSDCVCGKNCGKYAGWIEEYSKKYGIDDASLVLSVIIQESRCDSSKVSGSNAVGLMQLTESTVEDKNTGCGRSFNDVKTSSENNIECGIKILKSKYDLFNHNLCTSEDDCPHPFNIEAADKKPALKLCNGKFCLTDCVRRVCKYQFTGCDVNEYYSGWKAAVRAYNGWGCNEDYKIQDKYVQYVYSIQEELGRVTV